MIAALQTVILGTVVDESGRPPQVWFPAALDGAQLVECKLPVQVWNGSAWVRAV